MKEYYRTFFLVCLLTMICIGCAPRMAPPPAVMPAAPPEEILRGLSSRVPRDAMLRSKARFSAKSEKGKLSTGIILLAKKPGYLRIEALSLMGLPEIVLAANTKYLKIFAVRDEKFYVGSADQDLSRFFPIYLSAQEAVALMLGMPPRGNKSASAVKSRMENNLYRIDLLSGSETEQTLWLDPVLLHLLKIEKFEAGESLYSAEFQNYRKIGGAELPARIDIHFNRPESVDLSLRFSESELEKGGEEDFDIEPPEGVKPIYLE